MFFLPSI